MITMLDVARKAGVSKATVSRVLAGNRDVSKSTQQKVFQAMRKPATAQICWRAVWQRKNRRISA
ncbi:hypothetical protein E05_42620 [Plautia stali symbiont]|nr:hypothetical protein E05_42620 [Plautia stali symbiont]